MGPDSHLRSPTHFTLNNSWVSATLLSPCSYAVNRLALSRKGEHASRSVQVLQYFAKPIDAGIQSVAMLVFTFYDHFRDLSFEFQHHNVKKIIIKSICTPVTLPLKMVAAAFVSAGFLLGGVFQLIFPYQALYSVVKGKHAAHFYFYEQERWRSQFDPDSFPLKPITLLPAYDTDVGNPFWEKREEIFEKIDAQFRKRIGSECDTHTDIFREYRTLMQEQRENQKFILSNHASQDPSIQAAVAVCQKSLNRLAEIVQQIQTAERQWESIDNLSRGYEAVIQDGVPFPLKISY